MESRVEQVIEDGRALLAKGVTKHRIAVVSGVHEACTRKLDCDGYSINSKTLHKLDIGIQKLQRQLEKPDD